MPIRPLSLLVLALFAACAAFAPSAARASAPPGDYVDALSYFQSDAQYEAWFALTHGLERNFDDICGDTFCEGDYSNYRSLRYACSVDRATGRIGMCTWSFAASSEEVDAATGRISTQRAFWRCRTPLARDTTIDELLTALQGERPLYAALPHAQTTVMDGLIDCL
jgi:hypothetical protein